MPEYIDREEAKDELCDRCINVVSCARGDNDCPIKRGLNAIPAADVKPVVRGSWSRFDYFPVGHDYECSKCGYMNDMMSNYCPNCGADMREQNE